MHNVDESREERSNDARVASDDRDDYAAQIAVVFEWRLKRALMTQSSRERSASNDLWMSRTKRPTDATS